ncbi:MAG: ABC transporter substrate-binding protein [Acidimicrobiia bacterium]|nr:ABC transporter substrate-binding protein [Acidimicrobiia bacterium]
MTTRSERHPLFVLVGMLIAFGLVAAACGQAGTDDDGDEAGPPVDVDEEGNVLIDVLVEASGDPQPGGRLAFGLAAETDGWNVTADRWAGSAYIVGNALYDPLMAYDEDFRPAPYLAQSVEPNDDFTEWRIELRPGVTFHDGSPVDAQAVADNLIAHRLSGLTSPAVTFIGMDESGESPEPMISTDGPNTVVVEMELPWSTFPDALTSQIGYIMAPSMMESETGSRNPSGSGPFVFQSWQAGSTLRAIKNDDYWREGLPYLEEVEFRILDQVSARGNALTSGEVQVIETQDASQIVEFAGRAERGEFQMFTDGNSETNETFIALNVSQPPFDDPLARQAIAYAVNRDDLSEAAYEGIFPPAYGPFKPTSPWYVETEIPRYDPDKARELVAEYEEKYGEPLSFAVNIVPDPAIQRIAETLQQQAQEVGIEPQLESLDQASLILQAISGTYEATGFILFGAPILDRDYVFMTNFPEGSALNFTRNENPTIVEAMNAARATDDEDVWKEQWGIVQEEMAKDLNFIFLVHNVSAVVFDNSVHGLAEPTLPDGEAGARSVTPFLTEAWRGA